MMWTGSPDRSSQDQVKSSFIFWESELKFIDSESRSVLVYTKLPHGSGRTVREELQEEKYPMLTASMKGQYNCTSSHPYLRMLHYYI